ncbi:MAG: DUF11 domain-containing protein [Bacteroidetes bacterium]|nr:DUF11 domain-containing protein [Bacteroidota bacterium]
MKHYHQRRSGLMSRWLTAVFLLAFGAGYAQLVVTPAVTGTCSGNDGSVTFTLAGGNAGTHYYSLYGTNYYPQQTSPIFTGLAAGNYTVWVNGASDSAYASFTISSKVAIVPVVTNTTCPTNQGSISVSVSGGTAPYTYAWSNGPSTASISGLAGGRYSLTVTDASGCTAALDTQVFATSPMTVSLTSGGAQCNPTLTALATGGTGTVSYHWSTGATASSISSLPTTGWYGVTATDANGCTADQWLYAGPTALSIDSGHGGSVSIQYPGCAASTGTITVHIRDGQVPYTWHWSGSASTDSIASGLATGYYGVTVTDANGCTGSGYYNVYTGNGMSAYIYPVANPTCGASDGSIQAYAYGGSSVYTYVWSAGSGTAAVHSNLAAGTYTVTATDQNGCSATASYVLRGEAAYSVSATSTPSSCDSSLYTGTATAIVSGSGGTAPYTYTWHPFYSTNPTVLGTGQTITGLGPNTVAVVEVTDANGCLPQHGTNNDTVFINVDPACFFHITGHIYSDVNNNCTQDVGETGFTSAFAVITGSNGSVSYASVDPTGYYDATVMQGAYTITLSMRGDTGCAANNCTASYTVSLTTAGQTASGNDFGIDPGATAYNLGVHAGCAPSIPGGTKDYWVYYYNSGQISVPGTVVSFIHDPNLTLVSSTPAYDNYDAATHTVSWNIGTLAADQNLNWQQVVHMTFNVPNTLTLGSYLACTAQISPSAADCNIGDNTENIYDEVRGSHDPNDKAVYPTGALSAEGDVLHYTIRFQNDGNAPASLVVVKDTLSQFVDPASVVPGASSHPYKFFLSGNGALTFRFENINLPDSVHDEPHSKGFVNYTVHTKPNLPIGTQVKNTANIYFDFNQPVVTNTTVNTRSDLTGFNTISNSGSMQVSITPNPVQAQSQVHFSGTTGDISFELMEVTGRKVMETTTDKDFLLSGATLAPGMYTYIARDQAGHIRSGKVSISH